MNVAALMLIAATGMRPGGDLRDSAMGVPAPAAGGATVTIDALPYARTVVCMDGAGYSLTGTATGGAAVTWSTSPSGDSGACTGTDTWDCEIEVAPSAEGEGVETVTITSGAATDTVDLGFYVDGSQSCFLSQNVDGFYNGSLVDDDAVDYWYNAGSSALDVRQLTGTAQPLFKTAIVDGQPVVRFDGGDRLGADVSTVADWTFLSNGSGATIDTVAKTTSAAGIQMLATTSRVSLSAQIGWAQAINSTYRAQTYLVNGSSFALNLAGANNSVSSSQFDLIQYTLASADTPDFSGYVNGASVISGTPVSYSALTPDTPLFIGAISSSSFAFTGDLFRVIIYESALTSTQRGINKAVDEWALGGTLPVTP